MAQYRGPSAEEGYTYQRQAQVFNPWEGPFIIVDVAALGAYVLAEVDGGMLQNTWNADQVRKYYV
jgi:hypothetical protein